jgi:hypothetical protein
LLSDLIITSFLIKDEKFGFKEKEQNNLGQQKSKHILFLHPSAVSYLSSTSSNFDLNFSPCPSLTGSVTYGLLSLVSISDYTASKDSEQQKKGCEKKWSWPTLRY